MYRVEFTTQARKDLKSLPKNISARVLSKLRGVAKDPFRKNNNVKALANSEGYRLRVGDYRAVYYLREEKLVLTLIRIMHRKEVYR
jgi:mRNA interferase RelE/StbE